MRDGRCVTRAFARVATGRLVAVARYSVLHGSQQLFASRSNFSYQNNFARRSFLYVVRAASVPTR